MAWNPHNMNTCQYDRKISLPFHYDMREGWLRFGFVNIINPRGKRAGMSGILKEIAFLTIMVFTKIM